MITLNTKNKYPLNFYLVIFISTFIPILIFSFICMGMYKSFFTTLFSFLIIFELPIMIYYIFKFDSVSFVVNEDKITINKGVLIKRSNTITYDKIQNIECITGMLLGMCSVTRLDLWTSSPSQVVITKGTSQNIAQGVLFLNSIDADWLKNYILSKSVPAPVAPLSTQPVLTPQS